MWNICNQSGEILCTVFFVVYSMYSVCLHFGVTLLRISLKSSFYLQNRISGDSSWIIGYGSFVVRVHG